MTKLQIAEELKKDIKYKDVSITYLTRKLKNELEEMLKNINAPTLTENKKTSEGTYSISLYKEYEKNGDSSIFELDIEQNIINDMINSSKLTINLEELKNIDPKWRRLHLLENMSDTDKSKYDKIIVLMREILTNKNYEKLDIIKNLIRLLRQYVKFSDTEKDEFGEVMTQLEFVKKMIKELPDDIWSNKNAKILDPANGVGPFPFMCVFFFMKGLEDQISNPQERFKHIVENIIHVCELQSKNMFLWICLIDIFDEYELNIFWGSFLDERFDYHMKNIWKVDKFDLIIGNPPYQKKDGGHGASAIPLYNLFTEKSIKISNKVSFVTPSRWFAGGKNLNKYRKMMIESNKLVYIKHFEKTKEIFGEEVDIPGGVSYFLFDNYFNDKCVFDNSFLDLKEFDIVVTNTTMTSLLKKLLNNQYFLNSICKGRGDNVFGIQTNDIRFENEKSESNILCHVSIQKGRYKFINKETIKNFDLVNSFSVITARANGTKPNFGNIFIGNPNEVLSGSYIFFTCKSKEEAESLISYMKTKLANKLLSLRKISQDIKPDTLKWIPLVPFDREWTDEKLFEYFNLTEEEKELILC